MRGVRNMSPAEEAFNLKYRLGGGSPKEFEFHRDCITEMRQTAHRGDMLYNMMLALRCPVVLSEQIQTGCGGIGYHT